jgi:pimeloyl-ACP methyl ester carboxylesterase
MPEVVQVVEQRTLDTPAVRFQYAVAGDGPPVVLVPGAGGWKLSLDRMISELSDSHRVFAVDPPGQGGTRVVDPVFGYDADAIARSLGDILDGVGLSATAVVGHSWGGGFALRLAQLHPDRVSRLALLAPGGLDVADVWEFRLLRQPLIGELATRFTSVAPARHMMRKSFARPDRDVGRGAAPRGDTADAISPGCGGAATGSAAGRAWRPVVRHRAGSGSSEVPDADPLGRPRPLLPHPAAGQVHQPPARRRGAHAGRLRALAP